MLTGAAASLAALGPARAHARGRLRLTPGSPRTCRPPQVGARHISAICQGPHPVAEDADVCASVMRFAESLRSRSELGWAGLRALSLACAAASAGRDAGRDSGLAGRAAPACWLAGCASGGTRASAAGSSPACWSRESHAPCRLLPRSPPPLRSAPPGWAEMAGDVGVAEGSVMTALLASKMWQPADLSPSEPLAGSCAARAWFVHGQARQACTVRRPVLGHGPPCAHASPPAPAPPPPPSTAAVLPSDEGLAALEAQRQRVRAVKAQARARW